MPKKISALNAAASITGTELIPLVIGGVTKTATPSQIAALSAGGSGSNVGGGVEVFKDVSAGALRHRTLTATGSAKKSLTQNANDIEIHAIAPGRFNVCDYGADPTGVTDSATAFNLAIAAANAAALTPGLYSAGAGIVYVPDGKYRLNSALTRLQPCVWLEGAMRPNYHGHGGVLIESYTTDTLLWLAEFNDMNVNCLNGVRNIHFRNKVDDSATFVRAITNATNATPIVITTSVAHGYTTGEPVSIHGVLGNTAANDTEANSFWDITVLSSTTFSLTGSVGNGAYTSGGYALVRPESLAISGATNTTPIVITSAAHGYTTGDPVQVRQVDGNTAANGIFTITVLDPDTFELDGSVGSGAYTGDGIVRKQHGQVLFETTAGACIASRGGVEHTIEDCTFEGYPINILFDGTESSSVHNCNISSTDGPGYSACYSNGVGLWLTDGDERGQGWTLSGCTNNNAIERGVFGGNKIDCLYGGINNILDGVNFEGSPFAYGHTAIGIASGVQPTLKSVTVEGYRGTGSRIIGVTGVIFQLSIVDSFLGGLDRSIDVDVGAAIYQFASLNTRYGGGTSGFAIAGASRISGFDSRNDWAPYAALTDLYGAAAAGLCVSRDSGNPPLGIGVNMTTPAQAMIDGFLLDNAAPIMRVTDAATVTRYEQSSPSRTQHYVNWAQRDAVTGHLGGGRKDFIESGDIGAAGADEDLAVYTVPASFDTYIHAEMTVTQWSDTTDTTHAKWKRTQQFRVIAGTIGAFAAGIADDVAVVTTGGGFTAPTFEDNGAGALVVRINAHATEATRYIVDTTYRVRVR